MLLAPGRRLGVYEVLSVIGAGGMGEVYRARDTTLQRDVALKVLPDAFARDPERLARFQREAQVLAALNHPNIAAIYGVRGVRRHAGAGAGAGRGPTLADRLAPRPAAARRGAADRRADRRRARGGARAGHRAPRSQAGQHQGAPRRHREGARLRPGQGARPAGRDADRPRPLADDHVAGADPRRAHPRHGRLHEPGAGHGPAGRRPQRRLGLRRRAATRCSPASAPFKGDDVADTLAAVLRAEPAWTALPAGTPPSIRRLLRRCLREGSETPAAAHRRRAARARRRRPAEAPRRSSPRRPARGWWRLGRAPRSPAPLPRSWWPGCARRRRRAGAPRDALLRSRRRTWPRA